MSFSPYVTCTKFFHHTSKRVKFTKKPTSTLILEIKVTGFKRAKLTVTSHKTLVNRNVTRYKKRITIVILPAQLESIKNSLLTARKGQNHLGWYCSVLKEIIT